MKIQKKMWSVVLAAIMSAALLLPGFAVPVQAAGAEPAMLSGSGVVHLNGEEKGTDSQHFAQYTYSAKLSTTYDYYHQLSGLSGFSSAERANAVQIYNEFALAGLGNTELEIPLEKVIAFTSATSSPTDSETSAAAKQVQNASQLAVDAVMRDRLDLFWVSVPDCTIWYYYTGNYNAATGRYHWEIDEVRISVKTKTGYAGNTASYIQNLQNAISNFYVSGSTRYEKLKSMHDTLCSRVTYSESSHAHDAYGALIDGKAVCEGYAKALKELCDREGIPCLLVSGTGVTPAGSDAHMWNYVRMEDGKWYAIDATWNDQESKIYTDYFLVGSDSVASNFDGRTFAQTHIVSGDFSGWGYDIFAVPELSKTAFNPNTAVTTFVPGDVDWDGNVSASDALWALKSAGALAVLSTDEKARADVNNDGFVDASDALLILKYAAGLIAGF